MKQQYTYTARRSQGASKWWVVPLIIVLLLLGMIGAYALMNEADDERSDTQSTQSQSSTADEAQPAENAPITEMSALLALSADTAQEGDRVAVQSATVAEVLNDRVFTVGENGQTQFALLSAPLDEGVAESNVQVEAGQTVMLRGQITTVPEDIMQLQNDYGLSEAQAQQLADKGFYVLVESIEQQ